MKLRYVPMSRTFTSMSGSSQLARKSMREFLSLNSLDSVAMSRSPQFARSSRREIFDMKSLSKISGFTLIELIISMALISILLISLTSIFISTLELQLRSQATSSRQEDAQYILSRLFYDVNQASSITTPAAVNTQTNSLVLTVNSQTWTFALSNGDLMLTTPAGSFQLNSYLTQVTQFDVKRVGNSTGNARVQVTLTTGNRISGSAGNETATYTTTYSKW